MAPRTQAVVEVRNSLCLLSARSQTGEGMRFLAALAAVTLLGVSPVALAALDDVDVGIEAGVGMSNHAANDRVARLTFRGLAWGEERSSAGWSIWWEASVGGWRYENEEENKR